MLNRKLMLKARAPAPAAGFVHTCRAKHTVVKALSPQSGKSRLRSVVARDGDDSEANLELQAPANELTAHMAGLTALKAQRAELKVQASGQPSLEAQIADLQAQVAEL